jgi:exosortase C (VPDSG-CTERM-specific)
MPSSASSPATVSPPSVADQARLRRFLFVCVGLTAAFSLPLFHVVSFALKSELYSFIVIVPVVSAYLVWIDRHLFFPLGQQPHSAWGIAWLIGGLALLAASLWLFFSTPKGPRVDSMALCVYALVCFLASASCFCLGHRSLRLLFFPIGFLIFMAPFPVAVEVGLETLLQHGSSWIAHQLFDLSSMPVYREKTFFQLPGFSMQVAPECSGIRSTLALFLTSLVAGQLFLRSPWKRAALAGLVLPIALVRNGFRVFVIGELCVKVGPHMINSWIHRHGGPAFFALSLIPFSIILYLLYRSDRRSAPTS